MKQDPEWNVPQFCQEAIQRFSPKLSQLRVETKGKIVSGLFQAEG